MRKINDTHNSKASLEVRELKDELSDAGLNTVSGGIIAILIGRTEVKDSHDRYA